MKNRQTILIYYTGNDGGKFYHGMDGNFSTDKGNAAHHWQSQFDAIVSELKSAGWKENFLMEFINYPNS